MGLVMQAYEQLEKEFGEWANVKNVVACSSGTTALHLALEALQLPQGSKVLVPDFTMVSCARAITLAGLVPVFVDCGDDLLITAANIFAVWDHDCTAVMPVHIYGRQCDMQPIIDFAYDHNLIVIEDLAEAHGIQPHPATHAACWSFYQNKVIAGEEGGAVSFKGEYTAKLARSLRCLGFTDAHDFTHHPRGINGRLSNANAELIRESLKHVHYNLTARREVETWYSETIPKEWHMPPRLVPWVYDIRIPGTDLNWVIKQLNAKNIPARHGFKPLSRQQEYTTGNDLDTNAGRLSKEIMYLPIYPDMTKLRVGQIVQHITSFVNRTQVHS
jgi:perosamine synthetase